MANNYEIDYSDERFTNVTDEKNEQLENINNRYNSMIEDTDNMYQGLIDQINQNADKQAELQQQQGDLALQKIEDRKQQAQKDYIKEQKGSYADYQRQVAGNNVLMAAQGLGHSGYSESSRVSMYNTYQSRVAVAKESLDRTMNDFAIQSKDAILQNSVALMQIYSDAAEKSAAYTLQAFKEKNNLINALIDKELAINSEYYGRWKDVQNQINTENALAEQIRQYNEKMAYQKERDEIADEQWEKQYQLAKKSSSGGSSGSGGGSNPIGKINNEATNPTQAAITGAVGIGATLSNPSGAATVNKQQNVQQSNGLPKDLGNSAKTQAKSDYYFKNTTSKNGGKDYQPRYIKNQKLKSCGKASELYTGGVKMPNGKVVTNQNIWRAGGSFYIWDGSTYIELSKPTNKNSIYSATLGW